MIIPTLGRLDSINRMNNAAFNYMSVANARMGLISMAGRPGMNMSTMAALDNQLECDMFQQGLIYKMSQMNEAQYKKLQDANIKRSFSTFA